MTGWCDYLCDFPDDDGVTLDAVLDALPSGSSIIHTPVPMFRLRLTSPGAAVALRLSVPGLQQVEGLTSGVEVLVPWSERACCERQIADLNHGSARWTRLERIEAREDVWLEFQEHWESYGCQWRQ